MSYNLPQLLQEHDLILAEGAIAELLRRHPEVEMHPTLFNSPLVYGPQSSKAIMTDIYQQYLRVAQEASLPMLLSAPTWRLDQERLRKAEANHELNTAAVQFMLNLRDAQQNQKPILVGALLGPQNDCYRADLALEAEEAEAFHTWQAQELAAAGADFLQAQTIPAVSEALGLAKAMSSTGKPYIVSFCTDSDGLVIDGTTLLEAMEFIDSSLGPDKPTGYYVNCMHPRFLLQRYEPGTLKRLVGIQANGSSKDVTQLDGSEATEADPIPEWADSMMRLHREHGVTVLGGCCGTSPGHLRALTKHSRVS